MSNDVIVINGCDEKFFPYMDESLRSLEALNIPDRADMGILDLGLSVEQVNSLSARGYIVKKPSWTLSLPETMREQHQIGLVARTALREYFPGYRVYLWFDADAWAQTPEFFDALVDGAKKNGAAVICEDGVGYKRDFVYAKWWFGNMMAAYGLVSGFLVAKRPVINIGILALSDTAPHWEAWLNYYVEFVKRRNKVNNQHSFNAAVSIEKLPCSYVSARCNWIPVLGVPTWDSENKLLCEPGPGGKPISVIHLAGPDKKRVYKLDKVGGGTVETALTWHEINMLRSS